MNEKIETNKSLAIEKLKGMGFEELQKINIFISGMEAMKSIESQKSA